MIKGYNRGKSLVTFLKVIKIYRWSRPSLSLVIGVLFPYLAVGSLKNINLALQNPPKRLYCLSGAMSFMNLEEACRACAAAIFGGQAEVELEGQTLPVQRNAAKLRCVDVTVGGEQLRIMEQNPKKETEWAEKAKAGAKIVWAFKGRAMFARLVDGQYTEIVKREI